MGQTRPGTKARSIIRAERFLRRSTKISTTTALSFFVLFSFDDNWSQNIFTLLYGVRSLKCLARLLRNTWGHRVTVPSPRVEHYRWSKTPHAWLMPYTRLRHPLACFVSVIPKPGSVGYYAKKHFLPLERSSSGIRDRSIWDI